MVIPKKEWFLINAVNTVSHHKHPETVSRGTAEVHGVRSVFLSLAAPVRLLEQPVLLWLTLPICILHLHNRPSPIQPPTTSSPPQRPHIHYLHPGCFSPHERGWPMSSGSGYLILWYTPITHTCTHGHTRTSTRKWFLPSFFISN